MKNILLYNNHNSRLKQVSKIRVCTHLSKGEIASTEPNTVLNISLAQATFARGAKLDWHIHSGGQYLLITEGTGYYQDRGKSIQTVLKGDIIKCLPGVEYWHGATATSSFAYIGTTPTQKRKIIWLKKVTDEDYKGGK